MITKSIYNVLAFFVTIFTLFDIVIIVKIYTNKKFIDKVAVYFREFVILFIVTLMLWCAFILFGVYFKI